MRDHWGSDSVKRQWCIGHLTLAFGHLNFFFLIGNVCLVDGASWVSLLNMRVEVFPTILVEETFMTFFALMCTFMEMVYRPWGNRLRIHQVLGSLKLIGVAKTPNLFLITFFHVKCLFLSSLSCSTDEMTRRLWGTDLEWKVLGRGSYRDEGGRSDEGGHISQRIKGTEGKSEGHEKKHHAPESPLHRIRHRGVKGEKVVSWPPSAPTNPCSWAQWYIVMSKTPKPPLAGGVPSWPIRLKRVAPHCPEKVYIGRSEAQTLG